MVQTLSRVMLPLTFGASLLLVALLAHQNYELRDRLADLQYRSLRPQAGQFVPGFVAWTQDRDSLQIVTGDPSARQVLLLFTTTCPYCRASVPAWNELARELAAEGVPVIGISLSPMDETESWTAEHALEYPVVRFPHVSYERMYRAKSVPATLVLDGEGRLLFVRMGEITKGEVSDSILAAARWQPV